MDTLREQVERLPRRVEFISGQQFTYVKLGDVLALLEEPPKPHDWRFYVNGTFCIRCNAALGDPSPCI